MRVVHAPGFLHLFNCPDCPLLLSSEALMLFLDPGETPVMATVVATVAPTFTCCPLGRRCISLPQWSYCLMWTNSCRGTTQDTQMTSNGETHTHADTHTRTCALQPGGHCSHMWSGAVTSAPHISVSSRWVDSVKPGGARCRGVKIICWLISPYFKVFNPPHPHCRFIHFSTERARGWLSPEPFIFRARPSSLFTRSFWCVKPFTDFMCIFPIFLFPSLAVHPDKITIATGQVAGTTPDGKVGMTLTFYHFFSGLILCYCSFWLTDVLDLQLWVWFSFSTWQQLAPHVRVWDSVSLNTLHVLGSGFFDRALVCLAFSKSVRKQHRNSRARNFRSEHVWIWLLFTFRMEETHCVPSMTPTTTSFLSGTGRERTDWLKLKWVKNKNINRILHAHV